MNPLGAKAIVLLANAVLLIIRRVYAGRSRCVPVVTHRMRPFSDVPLILAQVAFWLPIIWAVSPMIAFADYPLHPFPLVAGTVCYILGLWLFYRAHADLGTNWSPTLEVKKNHNLVTTGVYRQVRHPMYLASFIFSAGQLLAVPNFVAGPSLGIAMILIFVSRLAPEEQMMLEEFGEKYEAYRKRSKRLVPWVW